MAHWTKPRTWVTGETLVASIFNTHVRDNLDFLRDKDRVHAVQTQDNALKNDEWEVIKFGGESFDRGGMHSSRKREAQIKIRQDGLYYILFKIAFDTVDVDVLESVSADVSNDKLTKNSHGLSNGRVVKVSSLGTVTGISTGTDYYVVQASTSDTFKLSQTLGGSPVNLTGADASITVTTVPGDRSVMLRRNSDQSESSGHKLGTWAGEAEDGQATYVAGYVLARLKKGDHINLFAKQNSGTRGLKALSGSSSTSFLQAVQMGGTS